MEIAIFPIVLLVVLMLRSVDVCRRARRSRATMLRSVALVKEKKNQKGKKKKKKILKTFFFRFQKVGVCLRL